MQCFNHHQSPALGMCKHCCKGLCSECATDLGFGLACRGMHEDQVASLNSMTAKAGQLQSVNRSNKYLAPLFFVIVGSLFLGYGLLEGGRASNFMTIMGALFLLYGLFVFGVVRKAYAQPKA